VLFLSHVFALGAVLAAWGPDTSSSSTGTTTQLAVGIAIKGAWIQ